MERAFGILEFRAVDDEKRIIEGVASSDTLDDHGTVLEPGGARFSLPLPLLWQHDSGSPVGEVLDARVVGNQIRVRAQIRKIEEPGAFKDITDKAWQGVKHRLVRGFSVGFIPVKQVKNRFIEWSLRELSLVTIPSNQDATISLVRSSLAASGETKSPGVSGTETISNPKRKEKMTIQEQIQQHENSRAAKVARKQALIDASGAEGRTLDETETEEFDTLDSEIRSIDGHLTRLASLKRDNETRATPVNGATPAAASDSRGGVPIVRLRNNQEPGTGFARYVGVLAAAKGNRYEAAQMAEQRWGDQSHEVVTMLRTATAAGTTTDATWAAPLVPTNNLTGEFLEMLRPATIIGRVPGFKRVPFNIAMPSQTGGGTYNWTGEGKPKGVTKAAFGTVTLGFAKSTGIIVLSKELVKFSNPNAEVIIRDEMIQGMARFLDDQLMDPAVAAVANVNPASITYGITGTVAGGTTEAFARSDLRALLGGFVTGDYGLGGVVLLMNEGTAFTLGTMVNAVGEQAFPGLTATGGNILGIPVVTSNTIANDIWAVHAPSVLFADDGGVEIDMSEQASVQMDTEPDDPSDATTVMVSLWQRNLIGLRAERFINWKLARATAVRRIHTVAYV